MDDARRALEAAGIATNSILCLMLDLTLPEAAGTFVGVWGLAQATSVPRFLA